MNPESVKNVAQAFNEQMAAEIKAESDILSDQKKLGSEKMFDPKFLSQLKDDGFVDEKGEGSYQAWIASLEKFSSDRLAASKQAMQENMSRVLLDSLSNMFNDPNTKYDSGSVIQTALALESLMASMDTTSEAGKKQYDSLKKMYDYLQSLQIWLENPYNQMPGGELPKPDFPGGKPKLPFMGIPYDQVPKTKTNIPLLDGPSNFAIEGGHVQLYNPKIEWKGFNTPAFSSGWGAGSGGSPNVDVNVESTPVTLVIDGRTLARTLINYFPKVAAQTGTALTSPAGGAWMREKW
jgi:hypothetical protein